MGLLTTTDQTGEGHLDDADPIYSHKTLAERYNLGQILYLAQAGVVTVGNGTLHYVFPVAAIVVGVTPILDNASSSGAVTIDVHKFNTSDVDQNSFWHTTQANRPTIGASAKRDSPLETAPDENNTFAAGEWMRVDIDADGTGASDLVVAIRYVLG